jgi:midasin
VEQYFPIRGPKTTEMMDVDGDDSEALTARVFLNPELRDRIFLEARDIFFGSTALTPLTSASGFGSAIAEQLSLSIEQAEWVLGARTPELHIERSQSDGRIIGVQIGRTSLEARSPQRSHSVPNIIVNSFALHRPSLLLLEQLATAVRFNEPLLLVGETGTGKTTAIQYLASLLSHPITVFNLSNQTEVSDLVGGFKPIDARVPASNLLLKFISLFNGTFNARRNVEFDQAIRKAIQDTKWKRAVMMWRDAIAKAVSRIREG